MIIISEPGYGTVSFVFGNEAELTETIADLQGLLEMKRKTPGEKWPGVLAFQPSRLPSNDDVKQLQKMLARETERLAMGPKLEAIKGGAK